MIRALPLLLAGCFGMQPKAEHITAGVQVDDHVRGAELAASTEVRGVGLSSRVHGEELSREELVDGGVFDRHNRAFGLDVGLRLSLVGMTTTDLRFVRWFDIGADLGAGGAFAKPSRVETVGRVWVGGWVVLGVLPGNPHPSIVLDARRVLNDGWDNYSTFTIGLAYSWRKIGEFTMRD